MGSSTKKTTQKYKPAEHINKGSQQATALATEYASQPYRPYEGQRVADLSQNEQMAIDLARDQSGSALATLEGVNTDFRTADIQGYMNPFIKGALDPAARELRESALRQRNELAGNLSSRGAFSGSRAALQDSEVNRALTEGLGDLYGQGYAQAFDRAAALWGQDQDRAMRKAGLQSDVADRDMSRLLNSGGVERAVEQAKADFDYQQYTEGRDWSGKQAAFLTDVLSGLSGTYETTQTKKTKDKPSLGGQILGAATTIAGAYFSGGMSLAAGAAMKGMGGGGSGAGDVMDMGVAPAMATNLGNDYWGSASLPGNSAPPLGGWYTPPPPLSGGGT